MEFEPLYTLLTKEKEKLDNSERVIVDEKELLIGRIISVIVGFLINAVVEKLFYSYYTNPKLLHKGKLRKIYIDQLNSKCVDVAENAIDWANGNIDVTRMEIHRVVDADLDDLSQPQQREIFEKRKILVRNIVDYIAGMTDSYAIREYEKIK